MRSLWICAGTALAICCLWTAAARADVEVSVGYLNSGNPAYPPTANYAAPGGFPGSQVPFPFDNSSTNTMLSIWPSTQPHATGVILFNNTGNSPVTIGAGLNVAAGSQNGGVPYQNWDSPLPSYVTNFNPAIPSLPFTLQAGHSLVVAETWNFNFNTGQSAPNANAVVSGSINGIPFSFEDTGRVLYGHEGYESNPANYQTAWQSTTPFSQIGTVEICEPVPEPGTLALFGVVALTGLGGGFVRRRISCQPLSA